MNPDILKPGERCASTSNRNFEGRQGRGGRTHLVSPQMAAAAAIEGHFVDIRELELGAHGARSTVIARPRLGARPRRRRHRPDHPQAVPQADRAHRLRRVPVLRLGARSPAGTCPRNPILVAGRNFGCGSSREHAPWALEDYGFQAIVAPRFADIFYSNCTKIGLLPVVLDEDDVPRGRRRRRGRDRPRRAGGRATATARSRASRSTPRSSTGCSNGLDDIALTLQQAATIDALRGARASGRARSRPRSEVRAARWS